ncbi:YybS family protein [Priestia aryabhattai]|uniref:YybS family protein n=1 Tax=Priestia aryabhattai TaxID=412384 RepID=UPI003D288185
MKGIRYITEGAALLALFVALLLFSLYIPVVGTIFQLALAVPFIVYTVRHGWKKAILFLVVGLLLTLLFGNVLTLPFTLVFGIGGLAIGMLYRQKQKRYTILLGGTVAFSLGLLLLFVGANVIFNVNLMEQINNALDQSINQSIEMMKSLGQDVKESQIDQMRDAFDMFKNLLPLLIVMGGVILAFFSQLIATPILKRTGYEVQAFPPFRELKLPKSILWYYLIALILSFPSFNIEQGTFMYVAIINIVMGLQMLVVLQGISFIFYFSHQKGYPKAIPIVVTILALIIPIILQIVRILGIIDLGFNLRKQLDTKK